MRELSLDLINTPTVSFKGISLADIPEEKIEEVPALEEDIIYSLLLEQNPLIEKLVNKLGLVSDSTDRELKKVEVPKAWIEKNTKTLETLITLANKIIPVNTNLDKEEIVARLMETENISKDRAIKGIDLMIQKQIITQTPKGRFYLSDSSPF
jgi:hypothetical protein